MNDDRTRPHRFRFRLSTLLFIVAILALLIVVVVQQVQLERMRRLADAQRRHVDKLTLDNARVSEIAREQQDFLEREIRRRSPAEAPTAHKSR
jgi:hypothetical protein